MFLENYKLIRKASYMRYQTGYDNTPNLSVPCTPMSGPSSKHFVSVNQYTAGFANGFSMTSFGTSSIYDGNSSKTNSIYSIFLAIGDGTADVQETDYCLSGNVIPLTGVSCSENLIYTDTSVIKTMEIILKNNTGGDVTVGEHGLVSYCATTKTSNYDDYNSNYPMLFERTKLDTPLTVANGETLTITYTFENAL